jgi:hypothetical protein
MERSDAVRDGMLAFYDRFTAGDADAFEAGLATGDGVFVIGTAPGEGHWDRESWANAYRTQFTALGIRLEAGEDPVGYEEGTIGFCTDTPRFVMPDGSYLPTRLTAVLRDEDDAWKVVHLHFSVGVPDEDAIQAPG